MMIDVVVSAYMRAFLIRHGQKKTHPGDPALTPLGWWQADQTGLYLKQYAIDYVVASPLTRTQQTARSIADHLGLAVETSELLRERADWQPQHPVEQFVSWWQKASRQRDYQPPVGDSSIKAGQRIEHLLRELSQTGKVQQAVAVSHGGVITDFLRNVVGDEYLLTRFFPDQKALYLTSIPECSITEVELTADGWQVHQLFRATHVTVVPPKNQNEE